MWSKYSASVDHRLAVAGDGHDGGIQDDGQQAAGNHEVNLRVCTAKAYLAGDLAEVDAEHPLGDIADETSRPPTAPKTR